MKGDAALTPCSMRRGLNAEPVNSSWQCLEGAGRARHECDNPSVPFSGPLLIRIPSHPNIIPCLRQFDAGSPLGTGAQPCTSPRYVGSRGNARARHIRRRFEVEVPNFMYGVQILYLPSRLGPHTMICGFLPWGFASLVCTLWSQIARKHVGLRPKSTWKPQSRYDLCTWSPRNRKRHQNRARILAPHP